MPPMKKHQGYAQSEGKPPFSFPSKEERKTRDPHRVSRSIRSGRRNRTHPFPFDGFGKTMDRESMVAGTREAHAPLIPINRATARIVLCDGSITTA